MVCDGSRAAPSLLLPQPVPDWTLFDSRLAYTEASVGSLVMTFPVPMGSASLAHDSAIDAWPTQGQMFTLANMGMTGEHESVTRRTLAADREDRIFTFRTPILVTQALVNPDKAQ